MFVLLPGELAVRMSVAELQQLLPEAPLGDILRLRKLFEDNLERVPDVPENCSWRWPALMISSGVLIMLGPYQGVYSPDFSHTMQRILVWVYAPGCQSVTTYLKI